MKKTNKISAVIQPMKFEEGNRDFYKMYFSYNDIDYCFLSEHPRELEIAMNLKDELPYIDGITCTDEFGISNGDDKVVATISGLDNIQDAIPCIAIACSGSSIPTDLSIYLEEKEYQLINHNNDKGTNIDTLYELLKDVNEIHPLEEEVSIKK